MTVYGMWALFAALAAAAASSKPWSASWIHGLRHARPRFSLRLPAAPLLSTQRIIGARYARRLLFNPPPPFRLTPLGRWSIWSLTGFMLVASPSVVDSLYPRNPGGSWDHLWKIWLIVLLAVRLSIRRGRSRPRSG